MAALPKTDFMTEQEYLAFDLDSDIRYEYVAGDVVAMTGASRKHNIIASNLHIELGNQLRERPCEIYQADMRVQVRQAGAYRYPDIVVVCGTPEFADTTPESLLNPTLLIEVLSDTTAHTDRIAKFDEYLLLPSLQEYVLISQDSPRIERYLRRDDGNWLYTDVHGMEREIALPSIGCTLALGEVFRRIDFMESDDETAPDEA